MLRSNYRRDHRNTHSDQPCPHATSKEELNIQNNRNIDLPPSALAEDADNPDDPIQSIVQQRGLRPGEKARLIEIEIREKQERERRALARRIEARQQELQAEFDKRDEKTNQDICAIYEDALDDVRAQLRAGYRAEMGDILKRHEREYRSRMRNYCK